MVHAYSGMTRSAWVSALMGSLYKELPQSSVHLGEALGEGEVGDVYRGEWQSPMGCVEVHGCESV